MRPSVSSLFLFCLFGPTPSSELHPLVPLSSFVFLGCFLFSAFNNHNNIVVVASSSPSNYNHHHYQTPTTWDTLAPLLHLYSCPFVLLSKMFSLRTAHPAQVSLVSSLPPSAHIWYSFGSFLTHLLLFSHSPSSVMLQRSLHPFPALQSLPDVCAPPAFY